MENNIYIPLDRAVIEVSGKDSNKFLQGIISNDLNKVSEDASIYAFQLTPQGKYLFDFFISESGGKYLIDVANSQKDEFLKKLKMYKLRSDVEVNDISQEKEVAALIGPKVFEKMGDGAEPGSVHGFCKGHAFVDPRSRSMYARSIIERENKYQAFHAQEFELGDIPDYHRLRIENNIPEGEFDLVQEKSFPLHFRMEEINGVDFEKGCYVGQEVTARTHHKGVVRKTSYHLEADGNIMHKNGDEINVDGKKLGQFLTVEKQQCLALLNVEFATSNKSFEFQGVKYSIRA